MITLQGLLIGTGILWLLNAALVLPLTNILVKQRLAQPVYSTISSDMQAAADHPEITSLVTWRSIRSSWDLPGSSSA